MRMNLPGIIRACLATCLLLVAAGAHAQSADLQEKQAELQVLQQELSALRQEAMAANPEFEQRQQSWQDAFMSMIRDEGVQPRQAIRRLQDMERELRGDALNEQERTAMREEFMALRERLMDARRNALQDQDLTEARESLQADLITAMAAINADAPEMIERFETLRSELMNTGHGSGAQ